MESNIENVIRAIVREEIAKVIKCTTQQVKVPQIEEKRYLTVKQATEVYCISRDTLRKYVQKKIIEGVKIGGKWKIETPADRAARIQNIN